MNNNFTKIFYKNYPEIKAQYIQLFTDMMLEVEPYFLKIKPEQEDLDFNTSFREYLFLKCISLNNAGKTAQAIIADKEMESIKNFKRSHHSSIKVADSYLTASHILFDMYEAGKSEFAYPIAILGINYANEYEGDKIPDVIQRIYNHTILKYVDMLAKQDFKKYGFLQAIAYIEYARLNTDIDAQKAEHYYICAAKILIKLFPHSSVINEAPSVLFNLASEIMFFISEKQAPAKIIKEVYTVLTYNKNLCSEENVYFQILKCWYITQCFVADKRYDEALEYAEQLEKFLSKSSVSYYPERYSLYKLLMELYEKTDDLIAYKRCQILAVNIKKLSFR